ncbi:unknown [Brachyspira sp. CAG:484]|nr:unknown [Brachyspira sp. CAG:484]
MSFGAVQTNSARVGTCPHGLPLGACPICNGMGGGGGMKKADFSAKPGEMSWNECAAIGAFLKAQQNAKLQRQQDAQNFAQQAIAFQNAMTNASQRMASLAQFFSANTPAIIARPVNFVLNNIIGSTINTIKNIPASISNAIQTLGQKLADISDKLTAMVGELKAAINKKISETFSELKKKVKSLFSIFSPQDADDEEKKIDETKKAFQLKTFIHDLYNKLTNENKKDIEKDEH